MGSTFNGSKEDEEQDHRTRLMSGADLPACQLRGRGWPARSGQLSSKLASRTRLLSIPLSLSGAVQSINLVSSSKVSIHCYHDGLDGIIELSICLSIGSGLTVSSRSPSRCVLHHSSLSSLLWPWHRSRSRLPTVSRDGSTRPRHTCRRPSRPTPS